LPNGIPSHDTFGRVFARINPEEFQTSFVKWVQIVADKVEGQVVAIDGKTSRRTHDKYSVPRKMDHRLSSKKGILRTCGE
jgi:hypothetical protein